MRKIKMRKMKITYNEAQLDAAALYVGTFSRHYYSFEDAKNDIMHTIKFHANDPETNCADTAAYSIMYYRNKDDDDVEVDIQVEPTLLFPTKGCSRVSFQINRATL